MKVELTASEMKQARDKRYRESPEGKAAQKRYRESPKGKATRVAWDSSPNGINYFVEWGCGALRCTDCGQLFTAAKVLERGWERVGLYRCVCDLCQDNED
jgi:hypothetical protein